MTRHARTVPPPSLVGLAVFGVFLLVSGLTWGIAAAWETTIADAGQWAATGAATTDELASDVSVAQPLADPPEPVPTPEPDAEFTIVAAGDVLPHLPVLRSARLADRSYDLTPLLAPVDPWIRGADLALCHLEVPVNPPGVAPSGYPLFSTVPAVVQALRDQGWDGCSTASNHSVDRGFAGVAATLDALDAAGLGHVGTARSATEAAQPQLYRLVRGGQTLTVAQISATYAVNGMPVETDKPWSVNRIDVPTLVAQAVAARSAGADLVVASIHCCVEYQSGPSAEQLAIDQGLAESGQIDVVLGHHAHVPQPVAKLAGGPRGEGMWVFYGLGNYLSNQDSDCCSPATDSGLLAAIHVRKPVDGPASVAALEWTGLTVDRVGKHRVYALPEITAGAGTLTSTEVARRAARVATAVGTQAAQRTTPLTPTGPVPTVVARTS
ncbi:CapA family protein [Pengzhenrongella phosphoraccumulans]|uniref:CapA family protein n=1 Tax=Pengzhenrongella phosphoraccumulans TaxID=3114394 RepID=UPI00389081EB